MYIQSKGLSLPVIEGSPMEGVYAFCAPGTELHSGDGKAKGLVLSV